MPRSLRVGVGSQTPLVRVGRSIDELVRKYGPLPDPLPLVRLRRGEDYSVTPGGVARMIHDAVRESRGLLAGRWVSLTNGFPRDIDLGSVVLSGARLPAVEAQRYGEFKEILWGALNGLPPEAEPSKLEGDPRLLAYFEWSRVNAARLMEAHREEPFDVFWINDWQHLPEAMHLEGAPRVYHFHAPIAEWTPPGWRDFVLAGFARYDSVVVSAPAYAEVARRARVPVHVVTPWLVPTAYAPPSARVGEGVLGRLGIRDGDEVVLHVGRMDPVKGQDRILAALPSVLRRRPRARLVLVGNGSFSSSKRGGIGLSKGKRWRARLEAMASALKIEERTTFAGHLRQPELLAMFHRADAFVFPSAAEGFGLAVAEAWLARKAVVVSPGAGISHLVRDGENGFVVDPADSVALADAIVQLLASPERAARLGEAGRETALDACDVAHRAPEIFEVLTAAAEGRRADLPEPRPP